MTSESHKYSRYLPQKQETRWATREEIQSSGTHVNLMDETIPVGGLPLMSNGTEAYVDGQDTHTLILGSTGSKKTRLFCIPTVDILLKAGESVVVTDPKGEIYSRTSGLAKARGYDVKVLNFREPNKGDFWNPLTLPYHLYHSPQQDLGISMLNDVVSVLARPQMENNKDPIWPELASAYALANFLLMMECGREAENNIASLVSLCSPANEEKLRRLVMHMQEDSLARLNYQTILGASEGTRRSVFSVLFGMLRVFTTNPSLMKMLSANTIDLQSVGKRKTAVYIIVPDEKTTFHFLIAMFVKQLYEVLIQQAQSSPDRKLPVRVNFIMDEFCNLPAIPDMPSMISAARSRNMRFYLVVQSLHQLKRKYNEDADTIRGNCDNWVFLTSRELELLQEISELCGSVQSASGEIRKLISVSQLQRLDKDKGQALILHARQYPMIGEMPDIDSYPGFREYPPVPMSDTQIDGVPFFSLDLLRKKIQARMIPWPFSGEEIEPETEENMDNLEMDDCLDDENAAADRRRKPDHQ